MTDELKIGEGGILPMVRDSTGRQSLDPSSVLLMILAGAQDPSAGAGVAADPGATFHRDNAGTGELWLKTGVADTAWTKVL
jgi:hypothetical protein